MVIKQRRKTTVAMMLVWVFMVLVGGIVQAQGVNIRFQTEHPQTYNVLWQGREYQSNERGELLITGVEAGKQTFRFAPDQGLYYYMHSLEIGVKDHFLMLRLPTDGQWVAFDPVTFNSIVMVTAGLKERKLPLPPVAKQEPLQVKETAQVVQVEAKVVKEEVKEVKREPVKAHPLPVITRLYERVGNEGIDMVFEVKDQEQRDTVVLFVPILKEPVKREGAWIKGERVESAGMIVAIEIKQPDAIFHRSSLRRNRL